MLSIDPPPCGLARCTNAKTATTTAATPSTMVTIFAGGKLRLAVPNSSPISNGIGCWGAAPCSGGAGEAGGVAGGLSAISSFAMGILGGFYCNAGRGGWVNVFGGGGMGLVWGWWGSGCLLRGGFGG